MAKSVFSSLSDIGTSFNKVADDVQKKLLQAGINTVNIQAAQTRNNAIENIGTTFTLRNKFTASSIRYTQCPRSVKDFDLIMSTVGATERAAYMERQEKGGIHRPVNGSRLAIPTTAARGGNNKNLIRQKYRMGKMQKTTRATKFNSYRANLVATAYEAYLNHLVLHYGKAIYTVDSFTKGDTVSFEKTQIYNKNLTQTVTNPTPWLEPATKEPAQNSQDIFNRQCDKLFI